MHLPSPKILRYLSFACLAFLVPKADGAPRYSVTDLGDLAGGENYSQAFDLNDSGQAVGVSQVSTRFRAFLFSGASAGSENLVDLGSLPALPGARANGINSLGQIVGSSTDGDKTRAFLWNPNTPNGAEGTMLELLGLPGERNGASATHINSFGQIVGSSRGHAYLWTPVSANGTDGSAIDLGGLPDAIGSLAFDVNHAGLVVGASGGRAFVWTPFQPNGMTGSMVDLGSLSGGNGESQAVAINAGGVIVGQSSTATGPHAVLWKPGAAGSAASIVDLGVLGGGSDSSSAFGANASNQVVGNSNSAEGDRAFLWTEAGGMMDLNSLTDASGRVWILRFAQSINDHSQIVGWGEFDPDGPGEIPPATHAFRLEPTSAQAEPAKLANISTRVRVLPGDNALIGGFIVTGTEPRKVIIRGLGPSLASVVDGALADPTLELHQGSVLLAQNDNWQDTQAAEIAATALQPAKNLESAIVRTLDPGSYTAVLRDGGAASGIGLVEVYDLGAGAASRLANISTRGFVGTADQVMIGGLIVTGDPAGSARVIIRAIGPALTNFGVPGALSDPVLELHDGNGALMASNDNWRSAQEAEIVATNLAPERDAESAIIETLAPGNYTAIVGGAAGATGVGLVEVYHLP
jgi:probable HAF family extracellular repeat protein